MFQKTRDGGYAIGAFNIENLEMSQAETAYTDPDDAVRFACETDVDSFAVATGTVYGFYHGKLRLDFDLLENIQSRASFLLVLHGVSSFSDSDVHKAVSLGISKVNFATELRFAYTDTVRLVLKDQKIYNLKSYGVIAQQAVKEKVIEKMMICGCRGKG